MSPDARAAYPVVAMCSAMSPRPLRLDPGPWQAAGLGVRVKLRMYWPPSFTSGMDRALAGQQRHVGALPTPLSEPHLPPVGHVKSVDSASRCERQRPLVTLNYRLEAAIPVGLTTLLSNTLLTGHSRANSAHRARWRQRDVDLQRMGSHSPGVGRRAATHELLPPTAADMTRPQRVMPAGERKRNGGRVRARSRMRAEASAAVGRGRPCV